MVHRPSSTNYLYGIYRGPAQTSPDYPAYRVAMALVGSELARTVREERGLSYVAYAPIEDRAVAMGGLYASATLPTLVIALMRQAVEGVRTARIPEITMQRFVHHYVTAYYADNETNGAQADEIARATLFLGDPRATARAAAAFERVTADAVRHAAVRYLHDVQFVYVGDTLVIRRQNLGGF
ncbi:MAG: insulinase family protein [Gemmatimonadaceae bacterium]|nr:insulinase family protein [Gemmatimonadaceae bacterium]